MRNKNRIRTGTGVRIRMEINLNSGPTTSMRIGIVDIISATT